jgi:periplasmic copper chaperone A
MTPPAPLCLPTAFLLGLSMLLSACAPAKVLYVDQAWVRLSANDGMPSGGYFTVHGGEEDVRLLSVISPAVLRVELHESIERDGVMSMQTVNGVNIPARTDVAFGPGGTHLMIWGINQGIRKQGKLPLTFIFSNGDRIIVDAVIRATGSGESAPPAHEHMEGMDMETMKH